jgi:hypothetical protein
MNPMPTARRGLTGVSVGGRLYASGGVDFARHAVATVELYDPEDGTWEPVPELPTARAFFAAVAMER